MRKSLHLTISFLFLYLCGQSQNSDTSRLKTSVNPNDDIVFTKTDVEAAQPANWAYYLQRSLQVPGDARLGSYTVNVQFIVDREGNVSNVKALSDPGFGLAQEAVRVIKIGPKWVPALQNGHTVKAYRVQPIRFVISE